MHSRGRDCKVSLPIVSENLCLCTTIQNPNSILRVSTVSELPTSYHGATVINPGIYPRSKLSAEMSQVQVPTKGLRKRISSEAMRESWKDCRCARKKEIDISDMLAVINGIKEKMEVTEARHKSEGQAKEEGRGPRKRFG